MQNAVPVGVKNIQQVAISLSSIYIKIRKLIYSTQNYYRVDDPLSL